MENNKIINEIIKMHPNFVRDRLEELDNEFLEGILYDDRSKILPYVSSYENFIKGLTLTDKQLEELIKIVDDSGRTNLGYDELKDYPPDYIIDIYNRIDELDVVPPSEEEILKMYNLFSEEFLKEIKEKKLDNFGMVTVDKYFECCSRIADNLLLNKVKFDYVWLYYKKADNYKLEDESVPYIVEEDGVKYIELDGIKYIEDKEVDEYLANGASLHYGYDIYSYVESEIYDVFFEPTYDYKIIRGKTIKKRLT